MAIRVYRGKPPELKEKLKKSKKKKERDPAALEQEPRKENKHAFSCRRCRVPAQNEGGPCDSFRSPILLLPPRFGVITVAGSSFLFAWLPRYPSASKKSSYLNKKKIEAMSSYGTMCQSHCSRSDGAQDFNGSSIPIQNISIAAKSPTNNGLPAPCSKCGAEERLYSNMCAVCFRGHVFGKSKLAVTNNAMISPSDNLLVAFSGGRASRVALQFLHEMQYKAFTSWVASKF